MDPGGPTVERDVGRHGPDGAEHGGRRRRADRRHGLAPDAPVEGSTGGGVGARWVAAGPGARSGGGARRGGAGAGAGAPPPARRPPVGGQRARPGRTPPPTGPWSRSVRSSDAASRHRPRSRCHRSRPEYRPAWWSAHRGHPAWPRRGRGRPGRRPRRGPTAGPGPRRWSAAAGPWPPGRLRSCRTPGRRRRRVSVDGVAPAAQARVTPVTPAVAAAARVDAAARVPERRRGAPLRRGSVIASPRTSAAGCGSSSWWSSW